MLKGIKQSLVTDIIAEIAHKDMTVAGCVFTLILLECPVDSHLYGSQGESQCIH